MAYWSPELTGVVVGGLLANILKPAADYFFRKRSDRRPVEHEAVDVALTLLDSLHGLTTTRLAQGMVVASSVQAGEHGYTAYRAAMDAGFLETASEQHSALDAFERALERVHNERARGQCAEYANLARALGKEVAAVLGANTEEAVVFLRGRRGREDRLEASRSATRTALGAARRA